MNTPRLMAYRDLEPSPWKNGLGVTREIGFVPSNSLAAGFRFRLSRAVIDAQAAFSRYPGVRRWLVLARGGALELRFNGQPTRQLDRIGDLCAFSGDDVVEGVPLDGPSEDFNLMLADPMLDAEVLVRPLVGSMILHQPADAWLLFHLLDGHAHLQGSAVAMAAGDTLWMDPVPADRIAARIDGGGSALILVIAARSSS
ncbi:MAG: HutD family protein [Xanthomonadales bacterium]|nr:HutD family protein [Xanthomonadales bacterium]MBP7622394.1 HutD family protein [Xanthomonadales bacterium]